MMNKKSDSAISASNPISHMMVPLRRHFTAFACCISLAGFAILSGCKSLDVQPSASVLGGPPAPVAHAPSASSSTPRVVYQPIAIETIPGWADDDDAEAWPAFLKSCRAMRFRPAWRDTCLAAEGMSVAEPGSVRRFFETHFQAYRVETVDGVDTGLVTGYYEPLLQGSKTSRAPYTVPIYGTPPDLLTIDISDVYPETKGLRLRGKLVGQRVIPYPSRAELDTTNALAGQEIVWVDDPIEAFFLQVQGSGRVALHDADGRVTETIRLSYADQNGRPYHSIGKWLVDQGEMTLDQASMQSIQEWARRHPARLNELLEANPSYVFFKASSVVDATEGPTGALGVALTPGRSVAVDAKVIPLGAPLFLSTVQPKTGDTIQRVVMAQDTGGAIATASGSAVRVDYFWGFGKDAGASAGRMKQPGRLWLLLPIGVAPPGKT